MARLVVGLGNPGKAYEKSKHNIGFICLDQYAKHKKLKFKKEPKFQAEVLINEHDLLIKPKTYMNLSGSAVKAIVDYYKISIDEILVISDDMDLPFAKVRLREQGSAGGHNGLKSIISSLGTSEFKRCRIGIDRNEAIDPKEHVLSDFSKVEMKKLTDLTISISSLIDDFLTNVPFPVIMNKYNIL
ncbi:MAG: aminoacyl-tRNA hydrolase [Candidatus Izemoplasmatales bacterium]|jgi:PTH1 family peptidyl-tRNA hydrolase|nr:aminoacyl-tRNA hydrolase [Candidatus Izemoplasmatales bacterium]